MCTCEKDTAFESDERILRTLSSRHWLLVLHASCSSWLTLACFTVPSEVLRSIKALDPAAPPSRPQPQQPRHRPQSLSQSRVHFTQPKSLIGRSQNPLANPELTSLNLSPSSAAPFSEPSPDPVPPQRVFSTHQQSPSVPEQVVSASRRSPDPSECSEAPTPVQGVTEGVIPAWLEGRLTRVGPGARHVGNTSYRHLFDPLALLHLVSIQRGDATYTSKYLDSDTYKANLAANRIVVGGFGTAPFPDPCRTLYDSITSWFTPTPKIKDNCLVNVLQVTDQMVVMTATDEVRVVDPETLDIIGDKRTISDYVAVRQASPHPHVDPDGTVYNLAASGSREGSTYNIISLPNGRIEQAKIEASILARWRFHPAYIHSFAITEHYFVLLDMPLNFGIGALLAGRYLGRSFQEAMVWYPNEKVQFRVIDRRTGLEHPTIFTSEAFFTFHHINAYETDDDMLVIDTSYIESGEVVKSLYFSNLNKSESDPTKMKFDCVAKRFVLPLGDVGEMPTESELLEDVADARLENQAGDSASARKVKDYTIHLQGLTLNPIFFEMPRINYAYNGKPYRYAYAVATEEKYFDFTMLVKLDVKTGEKKIWKDPAYMVSEPVFVASPESKSSGVEDDGVVLTLLLHKTNPRTVALLVLDAKDFNQIAKVEFETQGTVTPTFHGQFVSSFDQIHGY
ncbi:beta,beta-carotene 15,15'-dioxygenase-like [Penaeus japonicus]|uniref:beta,beta-carotene 15,15'-dioxygenase-like n=1 Tax=Penaeus japonicus TaxID=27405 RepID=UPI001C714E9C|nr:beta,beta-carotene 15,15'-dioxygenase-like [Penaeus japonicus]